MPQRYTSLSCAGSYSRTVPKFYQHYFVKKKALCGNTRTSPAERRHKSCSPNMMLDKMKLQLGAGRGGKMSGVLSITMLLSEDGQVLRLRRRGVSEIPLAVSSTCSSTTVEKKMSPVKWDKNNYQLKSRMPIMYLWKTFPANSIINFWILKCYEYYTTFFSHLFVLKLSLDYNNLNPSACLLNPSPCSTSFPQSYPSTIFFQDSYL